MKQCGDCHWYRYPNLVDGCNTGSGTCFRFPPSLPGVRNQYFTYKKEEWYRNHDDVIKINGLRAEVSLWDDACGEFKQVIVAEEKK